MAKISQAHFELGHDFFDPVMPVVFPKGDLKYFNSRAAQELNLSLSPSEIKKYFWKFESFTDNIPTPLALRYHGHQFLSYNPDLGDGRGFLFAQFYDSQNRLMDLGTKGSGTTPYSRQGDGRLTLKGAFREILATEMLESLGVNTSRTFCVFETGESLQRNDEPSPTRSGVLTRLCHSHIRLGTFQRLHFFQQAENIKKLVEHSVKYYQPALHKKNLKGAELTQAFFSEVVEKTAELVASVMMAGFVHGVLNTDNINITGELFDYGPYRFLPHYDLEFTAAYFNRQGLYCYGRQPVSFFWALEQLGKTLVYAEPEISVSTSLELFQKKFNDSVLDFFGRRLNLKLPSQEEAQTLLESFFELLEQPSLGFEQTFFDFFGGAPTNRWTQSPQKEFYSSPVAQKWIQSWSLIQPMNRQLNDHPYWQNEKPETLLIDEIEALWKPIAEKDDWAPFEEKLKQIRLFRGVF